MKRFLFVMVFACTIGYMASSAATTATGSIMAYTEHARELIQ